MSKCWAFGGTFKIDGVRYEVHCVLDKGHAGKHVSATMGRIQRWEGDYSKKKDEVALEMCPNGHVKLSTERKCVLCEFALPKSEVTERLRTRAASNHPGTVTKHVPGIWERFKNWWRSLFHKEG